MAPKNSGFHTKSPPALTQSRPFAGGHPAALFVDFPAFLNQAAQAYLRMRPLARNPFKYHLLLGTPPRPELAACTG